MPTNVDDIIKNLSPERRKKIDARAAELTAEVERRAKKTRPKRNRGRS
jgi:hypothetical protein